MVYNYKEYKHILDTPVKRQQEMAVVNKIMELLNKNKYDNIDEFITKNQTYQEFLKENHFETVVKHFGNTLNEEDYIKILTEMKKLTEKKKNFDKQGIETTNISDKQYIHYEGQDKSYFIDNSHSNMSIERQLEELQVTEEKFQTADEQQNTENMMEELEKNKKEILNLKYINEFDINMLNEHQKEILRVVANYQLTISGLVKIDIDKEVVVDEFNNIMKIEVRDGEIIIIDENNKSVNLIEEQVTETFQKTLTPSTNTIYSNN